MALHARWVTVLLLLVIGSAARSQAARLQASIDPSLGEHLQGQVLFLRGFPMADELEFDGTGALRSRSNVGPVTLSGVEVTGVQLGGKSLVVHGVRMALVARADGAPGMERKRIHSVTNIVFSLRRGDKRKYVADEEIQLLLHPDKSGSYEATLHKVFLSGFAELAAAVPAYWQCYARSYWGSAVSGSAVSGLAESGSAVSGSAVSEVGAEKAVERCVDTSDDGTVRLQSGNDGRTSSPALLSPLQLPPLYRASDLGVQGEAVIHVHVRPDGTPVGLQIVRAVGGGADEAILQVLSQARFQPAMRNGVAVPASMDLHVNFGVSSQLPSP